MPVAVSPKQYLAELREKIEEIKIQITSGKQPVFNDEELSQNEKWKMIRPYILLIF